VKDYFNNSELKEVMSNSGIVQGASGLFSSVTGLMDQARLVLYEKMSGLPLVGDKFAQMASDLQAEMDEKATEIKSTKKIQVDNSPLQPKFNVMGAPEQPIQFAQFGKTIPAPVAQQDLSEPPNSVMTSSETKQTVQNNGINTMTIERLLSMLIQEQQRGNNILKKLDTSVGFN